MVNNFIMNSSGWDYANLAKLAKKHGGPQKLMKEIYNAGRAADVANARLVGATVGVAVGATVGIAVYSGVLKWLSSKRKSKIEKLILQEEIEANQNWDEETGADL